MAGVDLVFRIYVHFAHSAIADYEKAKGNKQSSSSRNVRDAIGLAQLDCAASCIGLGILLRDGEEERGACGTPSSTAYPPCRSSSSVSFSSSPPLTVVHFPSSVDEPHQWPSAPSDGTSCLRSAPCGVPEPPPPLSPRSTVPHFISLGKQTLNQR